MTLPSSGTLGLGNDGASNGIGYELGAFYAYHGGIAMGDTFPEQLVGQSANQAINMGQFYGRSYGTTLYYSWNWYYTSDRNTNPTTQSQTYNNPGFTINGYSVFNIYVYNYYPYYYSGLIMNGYPPRYFFNSLTGYNYTATPGGAYYYYQGGGYSYYQWGGFSNTGLLYAPAYSNGSGYQTFRYN